MQPEIILYEYAPGTRERALHLQWTSFALTEMEACLWSDARNYWPIWSA